VGAADGAASSASVAAEGAGASDVICDGAQRRVCRFRLDSTPKRRPHISHANATE
jgi:hypothetical protein